MRKVCIVAVDVRSTHNIGSIIRTADGFSAEVILTGISPRPEGLVRDNRLPHISKKAHSAISKTALGAESSVNIRYFEDSVKAIEVLKSEGFLVCAIEQSDNSISIHEMEPNKDIAIVMGPEVTGLSDDMLKLCNHIYEIPMHGSKESFNVSVASGIALYQSRYTEY
jgi:tRNA G18 (ribose-2'-O)-methylase SpoU